MGEQGWISDFVDFSFFEKNAIRFFYCTNVLEVVWCGGNLVSELHFEHFEVDWKFPYKEGTAWKKWTGLRKTWITLCRVVGFEPFLLQTKLQDPYFLSMWLAWNCWLQKKSPIQPCSPTYQGGQPSWSLLSEQDESSNKTERSVWLKTKMGWRITRQTHHYSSEN